ncbi:EXS family-domain-containing protein [Geopyxis carbonaria]|nr:EXS family-domain-containing protein [Geopyxis carbonaria]
MDDPSEPPFESLNLYFPLPYRILSIAIAGVWLFALNLHYFHLVRIDISPLLRYTLSSSDPPLHRSVYTLAQLLTFLLTANLLLFWTLTHGVPASVQSHQLLPLSLCFLLALLLLAPLGSWHARGRRRFRRSLRRVLVGGLDADLRFADVLLADALTSYAKVLGDAATSTCQALRGYSATNPLPDRSCGGALLVPAVIALPYAARLRQCVTEYLRARRKGLPASDTRPHLYNAAKYASAFPVIVFSALQREYDPALPHVLTQRQLTLAWYGAVAFNSAFSFYWDLTRDWELTMLTGRRGADGHPWGLRANRHFVAKEFYYGAVAIDLMLRATWSVKLSPHLGHLNDMEGGLFALECLEVFRRWVWVFFRVEKEFIATKGGNVLVGAEEGIMMNEYQD